MEKQEITIKSQQDAVRKIADQYKNSPSDEMKYKLDRETDILRHLSNAKKGNPKERAQKAAEFAKRIALNRAIQQIG